MAKFKLSMGNRPKDIKKNAEFWKEERRLDMEYKKEQAKQAMRFHPYPGTVPYTEETAREYEEKLMEQERLKRIERKDELEKNKNWKLKDWIDYHKMKKPLGKIRLV